MKTIIMIAVLICVVISGCAPNKTVKASYPEKFEGLTQIVLASETRTLSFTDTTVQKILGFKLGSAQIQVTSSVTFDFYLDFDKDGYSMKFNATGDTLTFNAPMLRVKKPMLNGTQVNYPEKNLLINEQEKAVKRLETLTDEFNNDGEALLREEYVIEKCREMLTKYLLDLCIKMGYPVKVIIIKFPQILSMS